MVTIKISDVYPAAVRWAKLAPEKRNEITCDTSERGWYACQVEDGRYCRFLNNGDTEIRAQDYYTLNSILKADELLEEDFTEFVEKVISVDPEMAEPFCPFASSYCNVAYSGECFGCEMARKAYDSKK